jgi:hypothetical protein
MLQQQQQKIKNKKYCIGCLVLCTGSSMEKMKPNLKEQAKSILAPGLEFQLGHLIIDLCISRQGSSIA